MHKKILSSITLLSIFLMVFISCASIKNDSSKYVFDNSEKYYREPADGKSGWYTLVRLFDTDGKRIDSGYGIGDSERYSNGTLSYVKIDDIDGVSFLRGYDKNGNLFYDKMVSYYENTDDIDAHSVEYLCDCAGYLFIGDTNGKEAFKSHCKPDECDYDSNDTPIRFKLPDAEWHKEQDDGNLEHWESTDGQEEWYDRNGVLIHRISVGGEYGNTVYKYNFWFDYDYYADGKVKAIYTMEN